MITTDENVQPVTAVNCDVYRARFGFGCASTTIFLSLLQNQQRSFTFVKMKTYRESGGEMASRTEESEQ